VETPFWAANDSCQELSAELAGEGGATICSPLDHGDLNWNDSWAAPGVLGANDSLAWKGLKGPRGNGSMRGRGGNRRSSPSPELDMVEVEDFKELVRC